MVPYKSSTAALKRKGRPLTRILLLGAPMLLLVGSAHAAGDSQKGQAIFKQCALCHTAEPGKNKLGPSLFGVVGRESGSLPNYSYSDAMKNFHHKWTPEELNTYLTDPRKIVPGTKMIFPGLKDQHERDDVIAYLETLK